MNCKECTERTNEYIENELSSNEKQLVESHLTSCPECYQKLKEVRLAVSMVRGLDTLELPTELAQALRSIAPETSPARASRHIKQVKRPWFLKPSFRLLVATGAVAALALVFGVSQLLVSTGTAPDIAKLTDQKLNSTNSRVAQSTAEQSTKDGAADSASPETFSLESADKAAAPLAALREKDAADSRESAPAEQTLPRGLTSDSSSVNETEREFPIVKASRSNYNFETATALLRDVKAKSSNAYTIEDARAKQATFITLIEQKITQRGGKGEMIRAPLESLLKETKRAALPTYMEKAKYNGKDAWLIIIRWDIGGANKSLTKASLFITDLSGWKTLEYIPE